MSIPENFKLQNIFLNEGNRPYCEDWSYIDTVPEVMSHRQQKIHRQALLE